MPDSPSDGPEPGKSTEPVVAPVFDAARGLHWFSDAFAVLRQQPFRLLVLGLVLQLLGGFSQAGIFGVLFVIAAPALAAGMLQGMHETAQGGRPRILVLFSAFGPSGRLPALLMLGLITLMFSIVVVALVVGSSLSGLDPELIARMEAGDTSAVNDLDPQILVRSMLALLFGVMVGASLGFYAVPLIWFCQLSLARAVWLGLWTMLRQWRALLVLALLMALLGLPVASAAAMAVAAQQASGSPSSLLMMFMIMMMVAYQLVVFASQYVSFTELFSGPSADQPGPPGDGDQLVA